MFRVAVVLICEQHQRYSFTWRIALLLNVKGMVGEADEKREKRVGLSLVIHHLPFIYSSSESFPETKA